MDNNGLVFNNSIFIPPEIVTHILSFVHPYTLVRSCKLVCRNWSDIIENDILWKLLKLKYPYPFGVNLLRNNCAQERLEHWRVKRPYTHLNENSGWWIEDIPCGADPLPENKDFEGFSSCFSTSFQKCVKEQEIDLIQNGISGYVMDMWQPKIIVSEWFAGRFDCGCTYDLTALLLDENKTILAEKSTGGTVKQWEGKAWQKVVINFENYGPGVRFIVFHHQGKDTQFWAGQYGSKMSGGVVKLTLSAGN